ncbi:MAG: protein kinase [Polyangiales bacterium]
MSQTILQELAEKRVGRTLKGKWTLDEIIGLGGMAAVYGATHRNGARVAIKVLHATLCSSPELSKRFVREGYLGNKVDHPGVVRVLDDDVDDTDGAAFLVMDRVDGQSLCDHVGDRLLDELDALDVAEQVLDILVAAHDKGVVHRDLKPDNLVVDENGAIRLLDFGIARLLEDDGAVHTKTGITFGTPGYMAPEQALGQKDRISAKTDLYAVGATLFMLLTGEFVQLADSPQELLVRIATRPARQLADALPGVSADLASIVDRATRLDPEDRWPCAQVMLDEVRRVQALRGVARIVEVPQRRLTGRRQRIEIAPPTRVSPLQAAHDAPTVGAEPVAKERLSLRPPSAMLTTRPSLARHESKKRRGAWVVASLLSACVAVFVVSFPRQATQPAGAAESTQTATAEAIAENVPAQMTADITASKDEGAPHSTDLALAQPATKPDLKPAVAKPPVTAKKPGSTFTMQAQAPGKITLVTTDHRKAK